MQWFVANMWMALAIATVLGLLFGFSMRGLLATNRVRRATVEREIAKTELTQAKAEIEELYSAQRKRKEESAQAVGGDDTLRAELDERETRITSLGDELSAAREELEQLKTEGSNSNNIVENLGAAAAGAVAGAVLSGDDEKELTELRDRNTWLEQRVSLLEADITAAQKAATEAAEAAEAETVAAPVVVAETEPTSGPELEKLNWQSTYLRQRVDALESKLIAASAATPAIVEEVVEDKTPTIVAPVTDPEIDETAKAAADEELARLRWRNRYLEGRLAYFEEDSEGGEDEVATPAALVEAQPQPQPEPEPEAEPEAEPTPDVAAAAEPDVHPSEAMLAELEGAQPEQVEQPKEGGDDLTAITGIGPRIAEVLNGLGIWTYSQIAGWAPEHETWIENHLAFKGRVSRENWVGQASELMATA